MILRDGSLIYPTITKDNFINSESLLWNNNGLIGIISEDTTESMNVLGSPIVSKNSSVGRTINTFDVENGKITYLQVEPEPFKQHTDKIYEYRWRLQEEDRGGSQFPSENVQDNINTSLLRSDAISNDYIALVFYEISDEINSIDNFATEIILDYTYYEYTLGNHEHVNLRRDLSRYYIYLNSENKIYNFKTFSA